MVMLVTLVVGGALGALAVGLPRGAVSSKDRPALESPVAAKSSPRQTVGVRYENSPFVAGPGAVTVAGNGTQGFAGDAGNASEAELDAPGGLAEDRQGDLFVADTGNCRVPRSPRIAESNS